MVESYISKEMEKKDISQCFLNPVAKVIKLVYPFIDLFYFWPGISPEKGQDESG